MRVPSPSLRGTAILVLGALVAESFQPIVVLAQESSSASYSYESSATFSSSEEVSSSSEAVSSDSSSIDESSSSEWFEYSESSSVEYEGSSSSNVDYSSSSEETLSSSEESSSSFSSSSSSSESSEGNVGIDYASMMSRVLAFREEEPMILSDGTTDTLSVLANDLNTLKTMEEAKMQSLSLSTELIESQLQTIDAIIGSLTQPLTQSDTMLIPENPSAFEREEDDTTVRFLDAQDIDIVDLQEEWMPQLSLLERVRQFFIPTADADPVQELPLLADVQADGKEIVMTDEIRILADELDRNPVKIMNYVRSAVAFEPYATSKKGAVGCLRDLVCNDVDTAALTIALLRASGVPARYRKAAALLTRDQAQSLLGVDNPKSVYYLLSANGRPTYVVGSALPNPATTTLEQADFSSVTHFFTEWVGIEAFVDYDERGGSYVSVDDFSAAQSDADVADILQSSQKKTWIYLDPTLQGTSRTQKPLPANINMLSFIETHLKTADVRTPLDHFNTQAGVDVIDPAAQTMVTTTDIPYDILPPTPPYNLSIYGDVGTAAWSTLPDLFRQRVTVELKNTSNVVLLSKTVYAYEIQDQEFDITYQGATAQDQATIDSYGGIYATPPGLVYIVPVLSDGNITATGTVPVRIGESVLLSFIVQKRTQQQILESSTNQKFSVAGNNEGIYMTFSEGYADPARSTRELVLLGGNAGIARHYVAKFSSTKKQLSGVFDQTTVGNFARAVVTDNRIVSMVNGTPATFDFKGMTIDAHASITPASRRTTFSQKSYDLAVLLAAQLSDYEAGIFQELAGLEAVSTVRGVKYAAARPQEYTVHTIDSSNASIINSLQLSQNTKDNIAADVQAGARVITPHKPITNGEFSGIVYASLGPNLLRFAIGEQAQQNGGFTKHKFTIVNVVYGKKATYVAVAGTSDTLVHDEGLFGPKPAYCLYNSSLSQSIQAIAGYSESSHGYPCAEVTRSFGGQQHKVTLTEKAAHFKINGNGYWQPLQSAKSAIQNNSANAQLGTVTFDAKTFDFDSQTATYIWPAKTDKGDADFYFKPGSTNANGYAVYGSYRKKFQNIVYCPSSQNKCRMSLELGYPVSFEQNAPLYSDRIFQSSKFQQFIGGNLYLHREYSGISNGPHYAPKALVDQLSAQGGIPVHGAPIEDATLDPDTNIFGQLLESGYVVRSQSLLNATVPLGINKGEEMLNDELFQEGFYDAFLEQGIFGVAATIGAPGMTAAVVRSALALDGFIAKKFGVSFAKKLAAKTALKFVPVAGLVLTAVTTANVTAKIAPLMPKCLTSSSADGLPPSYYCGKASGHGVLVGIEVAAGIGTAAALNKFAVSTASFSDEIIDAARAGKTKLFGSKDMTSARGGEIGGWLGRLPGKVRTIVYGDINIMSDDALESAVKSDDYILGWVDRYVKLPLLNSLASGRVVLKSIHHIKFGEFKFRNGAWHYDGGHIYESLDDKISRGLLEAASDFAGNQRVTSLSQLSPSNGIRRVFVRIPGTEKWIEKTVFPKGVSDADWIDAANKAWNEGTRADDFAKNFTVSISSQEGTFSTNVRVVIFGKGPDADTIKTFYPIISLP